MTGLNGRRIGRLGKGRYRRRVSCEQLETRNLLAGDACISLLTDNGLSDIEADSCPAESQPVLRDDGSISTSQSVEGEALFDLASIPLLNSYPSANQSIYLDFDGQIVTNTDWNQHNDDRAIYAPAFDMDGDRHTFSQSELDTIENIWARVAEDFAPFDINVTTEEPASGDFIRGNRAIRILISSNFDTWTGNRWFHNVGGVAFVGSWRWNSDTPAWVFENNLSDDESRIAEAASHEAGHTLGLSHDGTLDGEEYFQGHGTGDLSWAPLMGTGYNKAVTQWSRGEYRNASSQQDDLTVIASTTNDISFRVDDHAASLNLATPLSEAKLTESWLSNFSSVESQLGKGVTGEGVITRSTDQDVFTFTSLGGHVRLQANPIEHGPNLDIQLLLIDSRGNLITKANPTDSLSAAIQLDLPMGDFYLVVDGVGQGNPGDDGYSDYGSLGQYTIVGEIHPPMATPPVNPTNNESSTDNSSSTNTTTQDSGDLPPKAVQRSPAVAIARQTARRQLTMRLIRREATAAMKLVSESGGLSSFEAMLQLLATWKG